MHLNQTPSTPIDHLNEPSTISVRHNSFMRDETKLKLDNTSQLNNNPSQISQGNNGKIPQVIMAIMVKAHEDRTSSDNSILNKQLMKKSIFKELSNKLSYDLVKSMVRQGCIKLLQEGDLLFNQGRKTKEIFILLYGEVAIVNEKAMYITIPSTHKNRRESQEQELEPGSKAERQNLWFLDRLINKVGLEPKNFKIKANVQHKKADHQKSMLIRGQTLQLRDLDDCQKISKQEILDVNSLFDQSSRHSQTLIVSKPSIIFNVTVDVFYEILYNIYQSRMYQVIKLFRKIPAFDPFQNSKLISLIQRLKKVQFKKGQYIYRQGDDTHCFYMLISGEIEISKSIQIFSENPNNLYKSRMKMSRERINEKIKVLPYANFNRVYNFVPQKKMITLSQISPICLFGQEEILSNVPRQVSAKVLTLNAQMYKIHLQDIEQVCNKMIGSNGLKKLTLIEFLNIIEERITMKKILLRQSQLSQMVSYENKNNFDKLFVDKQIRASTNLRKNHSRHKKVMAEQSSIDKTIVIEEQVPPQYNHFNYNQLMNQSGQFNLQIVKDLNQAEMKVAKLTHLRCQQPQTNKKKQNTIRKRNNLSANTQYRSRQKLTIQSFETLETMSHVAHRSSQKRRSNKSIQQNITIDKPLFNLNFFRQQAKQQKRLTTQARKNRLQQLYRGSMSGKKVKW